MMLVNETGQDLTYWISCDGDQANCGSIAVDGLANLPDYDNQQNVVVNFIPVSGPAFSINCATTGTDQQVEMALKAE
jgi:hypothetical protein